MNAKTAPIVLILTVIALALAVNLLTAPAPVTDTWYAPGMEKIYNPCHDGEESESCEHKTPPVYGSTSAEECLPAWQCEFDAFERIDP